MQVFRELYIIGGDPAQLAATAEAITALLTADWRRAKEDEELMREASLREEGGVFCFACKRRGRRPAATLFLTDRDQEHILHVANIIPEEGPELSRNDYNSILEEFVERFVRPAATLTRVLVNLTEPEADLERWLSAGAAQKLREFSEFASKWAVASHPAERRRWNDFVLAAHRGGAEFPASTLARWLHEEGGWNEELAYELAGQYQQARGLLAQADAQPAGV